MEAEYLQLQGELSTLRAMINDMQAEISRISAQREISGEELARANVSVGSSPITRIIVNGDDRISAEVSQKNGLVEINFSYNVDQDIRALVPPLLRLRTCNISESPATSFEFCALTDVQYRPVLPPLP